MDSTEVKQESVDLAESNPDNVEVSSEAHTYILQQQQLPYSNSSREVIPSESNNETEEPASKRPRRASAMRALEHMDSEDDDLDDGDDFAKAESDASDKEEDEEEESFQGPSTSLDDQPGPSGMGKGSSEASCLFKFESVEELEIHKSSHGEDSEDEKKEEKPTIVASNVDEKEKNTESTKPPLTYFVSESLVCDICFGVFSDKIEFDEHMEFHANLDPSFEIKDDKSCLKPEEYNASKIGTQKRKLERYTNRDNGKNNPKLMKSSQHVMHIDEEQEDSYDDSEEVKPNATKSRRPCAVRLNEVKHLLDENGTYKNAGHGRIKLFLCYKCLFKFKSVDELESHKCTHGEESEDEKKEEKIVSRVESEYKRESYIKSGVPCNLCDKVFSFKTSLSVHLQSFHLGIRYICEICGKHLASSNSLMLHMRTHSNEKPYGCKICGKRFARSCTRNDHQRTHTKHRPHICPICGKSFTQRTPLKTHIKSIHENERPFQCPLCPKAFVLNCLLKAHRNRHDELHR